MQLSLPFHKEWAEWAALHENNPTAIKFTKEGKMKGKKRTYLTTTKTVQLYKRLLEVTEREGEYVKFKENHSDATIADEFNSSTVKVAKFRNENIGNLRPKGNTKAGDKTRGLTVFALAKELTATQRKLDVLGTRYKDLSIRYNRLCTALALNRVYPDARTFLVPTDEPTPTSVAMAPGPKT